MQLTTTKTALHTQRFGALNQHQKGDTYFTLGKIIESKYYFFLIEIIIYSITLLLICFEHMVDVLHLI